MVLKVQGEGVEITWRS